jgi:predicted DsbA family dithiol-disulfide isomerase
LKRALDRRPELEVERRWRPFQLQPGMPEGGLPWKAFAERKFGGEARARAAYAQVAAAGAPDGARFDFDRVTSAPNTADAHRLVLFAGRHGRAWETADALFEAYFAGGADLNDLSQLAVIAASAGFEPAGVRGFLEGEELAAEVAASQREAYRRGVQGVPHYVLDGRLALSGAQPVEVFVEALDRAVNLAVSSGQPTLSV